MGSVRTWVGLQRTVGVAKSAVFGWVGKVLDGLRG
jgi:hypothetical protein